MKNLFLVALAILLIAGIGLGGCAKSTSAPASSSTTTSASSSTTTSASSPTPAKPVPQTGGILKILDEWTPSLPIGNPVKVNSFSEFILKPCFESLWLIDKSGALQPVLATSWEVSSNQTSITFHLRQGVKFHDGTDWNAAAAKWNMDAWKTAKREGTDIWSTIDVLDDYTIRLNLTKYQNTENMDLSSVTFMSPTAYQKNGEEWAGLNPVGTGPFKLKENVPKQYVKFERFAGYWGQQPYVDEIDISFVTDPTTISNAMQAKEAQIAIMGFDKALVDLKNLGFNVIFDDGFFFFAPSSADPNSPLSNLKVRQAIDYAIDRQVLSKNIASGLLQPVNQLVTSSSYAYNPDIEGRNYDPAKAKQLLAEAGYSNGFKTNIIHRTGAPDNLLLAVQSWLADVGIQAELQPVTPQTIYQYVVSKPWDGLLYSTAQLFGNEVVGVLTRAFTNRYGSVQLPQQWWDTLAKARSTQDMTTRDDLAKQVVRMAYDQATVIPIFGGADYVGVLANGVHDLDLFGKGMRYYWNPGKVWLDKAIQ